MSLVLLDHHFQERLGVILVYDRDFSFDLGWSVDGAPEGEREGGLVLTGLPRLLRKIRSQITIKFRVGKNGCKKNLSLREGLF